MIAACATPWGRGALAVLRLSGAGVDRVRDALLAPRRSGPWRPGRTRRVDVRDAQGVFDDGLAVWTPGPRTATGEDTLELTLHGNPLLVERALGAAVAAGARLAGPGEFTRRAVLNGRIDLVQAEAVDQLVRATSLEGARLARDGLSGRLSAELGELREALVGICAELEARLDYPGDALADVDDAALQAELAEVGARASRLAAGHAVGRRLVDGATVALVGGVNAGKSSLFNALLGARRALVHERAGTTRDVVEARMRLGPLELTLLDTAGERPTDDPVEAAGLALAAERVREADLRLVVHRAGPGPDPVAAAIHARAPGLAVWNGIDRADAGPGPAGAIRTSALTGEGLDGLRSALLAELLQVPVEGAGIASLRQASALRAIAAAAADALEALPVAGVAVASEIALEAVSALDELTGADTREDVLDALFARFCIGK